MIVIVSALDLSVASTQRFTISNSRLLAGSNPLPSERFQNQMCQQRPSVSEFNATMWTTPLC
jgi:hypothetical protein